MHILTESEIKDVITKEVVNDVEILELIRQFIFEKRGIDVGEIARPSNGTQLNLFSVAQETVISYYTKKFLDLNKNQ